VSCAARRDAVLLWAAGALDEPEAEALRAHLATGCAECAAHLAEARSVEAALVLAASDGEPAPQLQAELRSRIGRQRVPSSPRAARSWLPLALAAGLSALVAGSLGWLAALQRYAPALEEQAAQVSELRQRQGALEEDLAATRKEQEETDADLAELEARARILESDLERAQRQVAMLSAPGLVTLDLAGTAAQPGARAEVFWNWDDYYCYMRAEGLGAVQAPRIYALWLDTESGNQILAGTFAPEGGEATLWVQLPRDMGRALRAQVTLEPEAPGPVPAGPVQLVSATLHPS
jgi:hypothetical protein